MFGGSHSLIRGNTGGTIKIDRSSDNVIVGNTVQRVRVWGFGADQLAANNRIGGPASEDRNFITGYGTINGEGLPGGTTLQLFDTRDTLIENNWIGTTPDGMAQGSLASVVGIGFESNNHGTVIRDNRIAGILGHGQGPHHAGQLFGWAILVGGNVSDIEMAGNTIGLDANDEPTLGSVWGVDLGNVITSPLSAATVQFGGYGPGAGNVVAGHILNGITVGHDVPGVRLAGNSVHDNGWLGIDLIPTNYGYGVTLNDALDADTGGNGLQNFPELTSAVVEGASLRVVGTLHSSPSSDFTLDFFASATCDDDGFGEGELYLGSSEVSTNAAGDAAFDVTLGTAANSGVFVTATATLEPEGSTSEFSACVEASGDTCQEDLGFGGPGSAVLTLCGGDLSTGTSADLILAGAAPGQGGVLFVGPSFGPLPLLGGTLVPLPPTTISVQATDGSGSFSITGVPGGGGPLTLYAQFVYIDPTQPLGWGFSNALRVELLP